MNAYKFRPAAKLNFALAFFVAFFGSQSASAGEWYSCADDLYTLKRRSDDASDKAKDADSKSEELKRKRDDVDSKLSDYNSCRSYSQGYDFRRDGCQSKMDDYNSAVSYYNSALSTYKSSISDVSSALNDVSSAIRSVSSSCRTQSLTNTLDAFQLPVLTRGSGNAIKYKAVCDSIKSNRGKLPLSSVL